MKHIIVALAVLAIPATLAAAEAPGSGDSPAHWIWQVLGSEVAAALAGWLWLRLNDRIKSTRVSRALTAIHNGVSACYREYVRETKAASAGGKMTVAQKDRALRLAYETAVQFAKTDGLDLLKVFAEETVLTLIERAVSASKQKGAAPVDSVSVAVFGQAPALTAAPRPHPGGITL